MDNITPNEEPHTPEESTRTTDPDTEETIADMHRIDFLTMLEELEFR